jgi:hypothetical protein
MDVNSNVVWWLRLQEWKKFADRGWYRVRDSRVVLTLLNRIW